MYGHLPLHPRIRDPNFQDGIRGERSPHSGLMLDPFLMGGEEVVKLHGSPGHLLKDLQAGFTHGRVSLESLLEIGGHTTSLRLGKLGAVQNLLQVALHQTPPTDAELLDHLSVSNPESPDVGEIIRRSQVGAGKPLRRRPVLHPLLL